MYKISYEVLTGVNFHLNENWNASTKLSFGNTSYLYSIDSGRWPGEALIDSARVEIATAIDFYFSKLSMTFQRKLFRDLKMQIGIVGNYHFSDFRMEELKYLKNLVYQYENREYSGDSFWNGGLSLGLLYDFSRFRINFIYNLYLPERSLNLDNVGIRQNINLGFSVII